MSILSLPRVGAALLVVLLLASGLPVQASHGQDLHVSGVSDDRFTAGIPGQSMSFTVSNEGTAVWNKITISTNTANEVVAITGASAPGWTAGQPTDSDATLDKPDTIVLTGDTLSQFETVVVTLNFNTAAETGPGTVTVTGDSTTVPAPQSQAFPITVAPAALVVSKTSITLTEPSAADSFTVKLAEPPSASVQIGFSVPATAATVSPSTLTFTTTNWNNAQTVTVTPVPDNTDTVADRTATLLVQVIDANSADEYDGVTDVSVGITITDTDTAAIVAAAVDAAGAPDSSTVVYEGGATDRVAVKLATFPRADVKLTVSVSTPGQGQVTFSPSQLTFTPANGRTNQFVTITAVDDTASEILATSFDVTLTPVAADSSDEYKTVNAATVAAVVVDNEGAGVTIKQTDSDTSVSETAGSNTDTFTVELNRAPRANVIVNVVATQGTQSVPEITVSPAPLTFTPENWNVPKTVTVTALDDAIPEGTEIATITVSVDSSSSGEYVSVQPQTISVSITDDDEAGFVVAQSDAATITTEDGSTDTVTVVLTRQPTTNVVVKVTSKDIGEIGVAPPGSTLTFTPSNWNVAQTVTLVGQDDTDADGHQDVEIEFAIGAGSDAKWTGLPAQTITATNKDNEAVVLATPRSLAATEGESVTYELSMTIAPTGDVTVTIEPGTDLNTDVSSVTFTPSNWQTSKRITVTVIDDSAVGGDRTGTISHTVSAQGNYVGAATQGVTVTITDDDTIDIGVQNLALQKTVKVSRDGDTNTVSWDISVVDGSPAGIQIWRADSPFTIIANAEEGTAPYRLEQFADDAGSSASRYVATVFYSLTEEGGYFARGTSSLDLVPGYLGRSETSLEQIGASAPEDDDNTLLIVGIIIGLVAIAAIVVVVILLARRKRPDDDWQEEWAEPAAPTEDPWAVAPEEPAAESDAWSEETGDQAWEAPAEEAWDTAADEEWEAEETAWPVHEEVPLETFHLTCPQCDHDFSVQGHKPLETECPSCGVTGVLR